MKARRHPLGNPVLDQALAWVDCELHQESDGGDHTIVVGAVRALGARDGAEPLIFFKGGYFDGVPSRAGCWKASHDAGQAGHGRCRPRRL